MASSYLYNRAEQFAYMDALLNEIRQDGNRAVASGGCWEINWERGERKFGDWNGLWQSEWDGTTTFTVKTRQGPKPLCTCDAHCPEECPGDVCRCVKCKKSVYV